MGATKGRGQGEDGKGSLSQTKGICASEEGGLQGGGVAKAAAFSAATLWLLW